MFRDRILSLNFALSKLCETMMLFFSDGSFLFCARMFTGLFDRPTSLKFPFAFKCMFMEVSNCKSFPEVVHGR